MDALAHLSQESSLTATDDFDANQYPLQYLDMSWPLQLAQQQSDHQHHHPPPSQAEHVPHHQHTNTIDSSHNFAMTSPSSNEYAHNHSQQQQQYQHQHSNSNSPQQHQQQPILSHHHHHHHHQQQQQQQHISLQQPQQRHHLMNPPPNQQSILHGQWPFALQQQQQQRLHQQASGRQAHFPTEATLQQQYANSYADAINFVPHTQSGIPTTLTMTTTSDGAIMTYSDQPLNTPLAFYHNDLSSGLVDFPIQHRYSATFSNAPTLGTSPPTDNSIDSHSASSSECSWVNVDHPNSRQSFEAFVEVSPRQNIATLNPGSTLVNTTPLHIRSGSDSSHTDLSPSVVSLDDFPALYDSPPADAAQETQSAEPRRHMPLDNRGARQFAALYTQNALDITRSSPTSSSSPAPSPTSMVSGDSLTNRNRNRKSPSMKVSKPVTKKVIKKEPTGEKKVGRRRGPLRTEQRKSAAEIRKLRACLRCKFLKKTCDKGDPCAGCQPSHARLWQVPCTRIDIKDIGYFMKDWRADYERHVTLGFSITNIKGYSEQERGLWITHGYGFALPIQAREVFVRDDSCFNVDWVETIHETPRQFDMPTARLTTGADGIPYSILSQYLDRHIDHGFEKFVDNHFEGTKFLTEILKTVFRYYRCTQLPVIRKALKLVLAYNLTMHVTLVVGLSDEEELDGKIDDESSKNFGETLAPVMINFQIKCALAEMWRELQRDVLEELSALYSSVYNGDKLKNWPTIFMLATVLLSVWEQMQFDAHYRLTDPASVEKFCNDMESTPVGVIVGLFSAISQKLPALSEWDTSKHHHILNSNPAVCDALTEVREHVNKYEDYLRSRSESKFDREDFDCLTNKFLSKLVIRA